MKLFGGKDKEVFTLGLDLGSSSIKVVKLKFSKGQVQFCDFEIKPATLNPTDFLKSVKESKQVELVNAAVSGPSTVIRYATMPRMERQELQQALKFEAQKHIPFSVAETNLDGFILKDNLPDGKMLVVIAAVKKDFIHQRLKLIEDAGFRVGVMDIDSIAQVNVFNYNYTQEDYKDHKAIGLLNIGSAVTNLNILESGTPRLSRDIPIAGNAFTQKLADILGIDFKAAEELKLNPDKDPQNKAKVVSTVESVLTNLATEVRVSFDFFESQSSSSVTKIYLSGGSLKFPGLKEMLATLLGAEVASWDPLRNITISADTDSQKAQEASGQLAVAVGLALRKL